MHRDKKENYGDFSHITLASGVVRLPASEVARNRNGEKDSGISFSSHQAYLSRDLFYHRVSIKNRRNLSFLGTRRIIHKRSCIQIKKIEKYVAITATEALDAVRRGYGFCKICTPFIPRRMTGFRRFGAGRKKRWLTLES